MGFDSLKTMSENIYFSSCCFRLCSNCDLMQPFVSKSGHWVLEYSFVSSAQVFIEALEFIYRRYWLDCLMSLLIASNIINPFCFKWTITLINYKHMLIRLQDCYYFWCMQFFSPIHASMFDKVLAHHDNLAFVNFI